MVAGLSVAIGAMILSKNATRFFQNEARITHAQLSVNLGLARIAGDLQRAAFLSTPNVAADPLRCGAMGGWPAALSRLAGVSVVDQGSETYHSVGMLQQSIDNNMHPDTLMIGGAFSTTEQFPVKTITRDAAGYTVHLSTDNGAMARTLASAQEGAEPVCPVAVNTPAIFRPGRFARVIDKFGYHIYSVITGCDSTNINDILVTLSQNPVLPEKTNVTTCGLSQDHMTGLQINPVSRVLYDIRSLKGHPTYGPLVAPPADPLAATMSGDGTANPNQAGRTELVRVEIDDQDAEVPSTLELVAEYAVDFKIGVTATNANGPNPALVKFPIGGAAGYAVVAPLNIAGTAPERARALTVRLSTRARTPDRNDAPALAPGPVGQVGRFQLVAVPGPDRNVDGRNDVWARMRTLQADISLPNQANTQW